LSGVAAIKDGSVVWRRKVGGEIEVSAAVAPDGTVVVGNNDPYEYGLDPANGSVRWRYQRPAETYSSPVVTADGIAYFGDHHNWIVGLDARTGKRVFGFEGSQKNPGPFSIGIWTSIAVDAQHTVYAGTRAGLLYAVDRSGKQLWSMSLGSTLDSYPALTGDGALVIGVTDGRLLDIADN
jgi:outer membrane protein assembly factor BamB